jgi:lipoprotein-anchoring transpeptidase ErfK/SrfK
VPAGFRPASRTLARNTGETIVIDRSQRAMSRISAGAAFLLACSSLGALAATPPPPVTTVPALAAEPAKPAVPPLPETPAGVPAPSVLGNDPLPPGSFAWQPQFSSAGPLLVVVNIKEQTAYVYRNGLRIGRSSVSTGKEGHETPTGVFTILEKHAEHYSNKYNGAPMPFMQRLTWDGVALHAGKIPGYPASHGCVRLPYAFSELLFSATTTGVTVVIAADPGAAPTMVSGELMAPSTLSAQVEAAWQGASTWNPEASTQGPLTIVLSTHDGIAHVLRNGIEIGRARVAISGAPPTGTTAYVLLEGSTGEMSTIVPGKPALRWQAVGDAAAGEQVVPLGGEFAPHMSVPPAFAQKVYELLQPGTTVVITGEALSSDDKLTNLTIMRADEGPAVASGDAGEDEPR